MAAARGHTHARVSLQHCNKLRREHVVVAAVAERKVDAAAPGIYEAIVCKCNGMCIAAPDDET
jgi:hypothetical protein